MILSKRKIDQTLRLVARKKMKAKVEIHLFIGGLVDWKFLYVQVSMPEDNTSVQVIACNTST